MAGTPRQNYLPLEEEEEDAMSVSEVDGIYAKEDADSTSPPSGSADQRSRQTTTTKTTTTTIHHLPQEVLEHIFAMVSPYRDFKTVMLTCSWWRRIMRGVADRCAQEFVQSVKDGNVKWRCVRPRDGEPGEDDDATANQRLQRGEIIGKE